MNNEFLKVREHHEYLPGAMTKVPTWQEFIDELDYSMCNGLDMKGNNDGGLVVENSDHIRQSKNLEDRIANCNPGYHLTHTQIYISLSRMSTTFGKHNDTTDVWFWQCIGKTSWTVWDPEPITYILRPGDIIYTPVGMFHEPKPLTPRVGMSIGIKPL